VKENISATVLICVLFIHTKWAFIAC